MQDLRKCIATRCKRQVQLNTSIQPTMMFLRLEFLVRQFDVQFFRLMEQIHEFLHSYAKTREAKSISQNLEIDFGYRKICIPMQDDVERK